MSRQRILAGLLMGLALAGAGWPGVALGQEWSRFRGPNGTGISEAKGIPEKVTEKDYAWKVKLPGAGHSSPVLWGDRIFLTCTDDKGKASRMVVCIDAASGKELWSKSFEGRPQRLHQYNSYAASTPAADERHVYVTWATEREYIVLAMDHDGKEVWRKDLGPWKAEHGGGVSPMVYQGMVIVANEQDGASFNTALDGATGKEKWKLERDAKLAAYSTPAIRKRDDGKEELLFNSTANGITAVDPATGKVNWSMNDDLFKLRCCSSPVVADGLCIGTCGNGAGVNSVVAIKPGEKGKSEVVYTIKGRKMAPYVPTPLAKGSLLYLISDDGTASAFVAKTGEEKWRQSLNLRFFGSPVCVEDRIYVVSTNGVLVVLRAGEKFEEISRHELGETCHTTPAVARGRMFIRTLNHLVAIGGPAKVAEAGR